MALKPWYTVIAPREDLRSGKPLDAAEFAVHLDKVRDHSAAEAYSDPQQFFARTYLTKTLLGLSSEAVRRLSGERTETSAVFNLATQFGGGKTHALTLLYHLAKHGRAAEGWAGVPRILAQAGIPQMPDNAAVAVFVGTEFDSLTGRGGNDGTPRRRTPWGEIAYQLGGQPALDLLAEHEAQFIEPKGDVIRAFLPKDRPCLILMDEVINYVSTYRRLGYGSMLYNFLQSLSETARGEPNVVLVVSIPASELEYTAEDAADEQRFKKMLDRLGKAYMMSAETETAEIIRRRLFEWDLRAVGENGRVALNRDALDTCAAYAQWITNHRQSLPPTFPLDEARDAFASTYPFHPQVFSVFERKWQSLPRFQQTRGVLRLLAHWVTRAYRDGYTGVYRDPLIDLGTAPIDDPLFRAAVFGQLGEDKLEGPVTTDIAGQKDSHATRLDNEAVEAIRKTRLHRKVASAIFFESNGGQSQHYATLPEIRMAVAAPDLDIANVETVLESLVPPNGACYYLDTTKNRYWFSTRPNLVKILADRKAGVPPQRIEERVCAEIERAFAPLTGIERVFFPTSSGQIPNQPILTAVIMAPDQTPTDHAVLAHIERMTRESGGGARMYKSALVWVMAQGDAQMREEARKVLAWELINDEKDDLALDDGQKRQIDANLKRARDDVRESVWRAYNQIALLDKENQLQVRNLGLINSSTANSPLHLIVNRLRLEGDIEEAIGPNFLLRNWPAQPEWSTRAVRDAFFASPKFPRLLNAAVVRDTIARGVSNGFLAYVGKAPDGTYQPFLSGTPVTATDIEITDDVFIITKVVADAYKERIDERVKLAAIIIAPAQARLAAGAQQIFTAEGRDQRGQPFPLDGVRWSVSAGMITADGVFTAQGLSGPATVTATVGTISGTTTVIPETVVREGDDPSPPPPPPPPTMRRLTWSGAVPTQKWMTFYTKILARFTTLRGLTLTVRVELTPDVPLSPQQVDEMRLGLRELGLNEDVRLDG